MLTLKELFAVTTPTGFRSHLLAVLLLFIGFQWLCFLCCRDFRQTSNKRESKQACSNNNNSSSSKEEMKPKKSQ